MSVRVCVCVQEREREREGGRGRENTYKCICVRVYLCSCVCVCVCVCTYMYARVFVAVFAFPLLMCVLCALPAAAAGGIVNAIVYLLRPWVQIHTCFAIVASLLLLCCSVYCLSTSFCLA